MTVTKNFAEFGHREIGLAADLLTAFKEDKLTQRAKDQSDWDKIEVYFNTHSGNVFISDEDYNTLLLNDDGVLDLWLFTPYEGREGFADDLFDEWDSLNDEDKDYLWYYLDEEQQEHVKKEGYEPKDEE